MKNKLTAEWKIEVHDKEGKTVKRITKDADLIVWNWIKFAAGIAVPACIAEPLTFVDESGAERTRVISHWRSYLLYADCLPVIKLGSSATPPARADYRLGSPWAESPLLTPTVSNPEPNKWQYVISHLFSTTVPRILAELGTFLRNLERGVNILLCRDVLSPPIQIPAGGSVQVSYTIRTVSEG